MGRFTRRIRFKAVFGELPTANSACPGARALVTISGPSAFDPTLRLKARRGGMLDGSERCKGTCV